VTLAFARSLSDAELEAIRVATLARRAIRIPPRVHEAYARESELRFDQSSQPDVGGLLALLAAAVPIGGRVLELGTGAGVGLAWMVHGLGDRADVQVTSVELDAKRAARVRASEWPPWVSIVVGDGASLVGELGSFDLIFPDNKSNTGDQLAASIDALRPGGILVMDDTEPSSDDTPARRARLANLHKLLFSNDGLVCTEVGSSTGVMLVVKRRAPLMR
jgi:demethylmenaquinone methyltransferase/2-methoxy-6-polyprenyl-1,4-benzoquinol methylase